MVIKPQLNQFHPSRLDIGYIKSLKPSQPRPKVKGLVLESKTKPAHLLRFSFKALPPFVAACLIAVLGLQAIPLGVNKVFQSQARILGLSTNAYDELDLAADNFQKRNFLEAARLFDSAQYRLNYALVELNRYAGLDILSLQARSARSAIIAAADLSLAGKNVSEGLNLLNELQINSQGVQTENFLEKLRSNKKLMNEALDLLKSAEQKLDAADDLPPEYSEQIQIARSATSSFAYLVKKFIDLQDLYLLLAGDEPKTYLLIFPNTAEARATGGFIGTYGVLKIDQGKIRQLKIDSVYNFDGSLTTMIAAPGPMQPDIKSLGLRDGNWFADFPTSAKKLSYLFEKGSQTVNGVISITPKVFEDILNLIGPIEMPQYEVILTSANFHEIVQRKTSVEFDRAQNKPKKFLDDFAPILLNRLTSLDQTQWLDLLQMTQENLDTRQILVYSSEFETNFDGRILYADKDYLSIINSNLAGTKTDHDIKQEALLETKISRNGNIVNKLRFTRINPTKETNKDYVRVLVPAGSQLLSLEGSDKLPIYNSSASGLKTDPDLVNLEQTGMEAGKQVFAFWMNVEAGKSGTVTLIYTLPFKVRTNLIDRTDSYSLLFQKQPAHTPLKFSAKVELGEFEPLWLSNGALFDSGLIEYNSYDLTDDFWSAVLKK